MALEHAGDRKELLKGLGDLGVIGRDISDGSGSLSEL
jgi:hypothetical protein